MGDLKPENYWSCVLDSEEFAEILGLKSFDEIIDSGDFKVVGIDEIEALLPRNSHRGGSMVRMIHLHGSLGQRYGELHKFNLHTPGELVRAMEANYPGFCETIRPGAFHIVTGDLIKAKSALCAPELQMRFKEEDIHVLPALYGGKFDFLEVLLGVVMIAAAFALPGLGVPLDTALLGGTTIGGLSVFGTLFMGGAGASWKGTNLP